MSWAARFARAFTWRHAVCAIAIGAAWSLARRIGMVGNDVDAFAAHVWGYDLAQSIVAGFVFAAALVAAETRSPSSPGPSSVEYALAIAGASVAFVAISIWLLPPMPLGEPTNRAGEIFVARATFYQWGDHPAFKGMNAFRMLMFAVFTAAVFVWVRRSRQAQAALEGEMLALAAAGRRVAEARFASAHDAVEPSEVLGRLDAIEAAFAKDPSRADTMLDELIDYLRAAVPRVREVDGTDTVPP